MRKVVLTALAIVFISSVSFAQTKKETAKKPNPQTAASPQKQAPASTPAASQAQDTAAQSKQTLAGDFGALQNQEAKAIVLQQLLNREISELRQMQAVFCDQYNLDVEKWRSGGYQYDMKEGKFIERPAEKK